MEKTRLIQTGAGPVVVKKLALYDYSEFIRSLQSLPKEFGTLFSKTDNKQLKDTSYILSILPTMLSDSFEDFVRIVSVVTDKDVEFFKDPDLDMADVIDIVATALELNDYQRIVSSVKKIAALRREGSEQNREPEASQAEVSKKN